MGSLFSSPKPAPVYIPQPVYVPTPAPATPVTTTPAPAEDEDTKTSAEKARSAGLLERSRGILSTVLTGFDGILTKSTVPHGKSLLGE
jgi:hypothetical protein